MRIPEEVKFYFDTWYKVLMLVGVMLVVYSLIGPMSWLDNQTCGLIGVGLFLFGMSEWKRTKFIQWIKPPNVYTGPPMLITQEVKKHDLISVFFLILAFVCWLAAVGWHTGIDCASVAEWLCPGFVNQ